MKIGVPKEVKNHEYRVAITPIGVRELTARGHEVHVERGAGEGSAISDEQYVAAGAAILDGADEVWGAADLVLKVKEPVAQEYHRLREGLTLFTYLHLAADKPLTEELLARKVTGIAYETVQLPSGTLPLLYPMSEVAGCLAPQVGAHALLKAQGGGGVLLGGVGGVAKAVSYVANYPCYSLYAQSKGNAGTTKRRLAQKLFNSLPRSLRSTALPKKVYDGLHRSRYSSMVALKKVAEDERNWIWYRDF